MAAWRRLQTMTPINMPQVGQDIPTARIIEWTKKEGETIRKDEVVALVESDKATFEVQADRAGVLLKIIVPAGDEGEVLKPIAWLGEAGEQADLPSSGESSAAVSAAIQPVAIESAVQASPPARQFSSPSARRVAHELGIDLTTAKGSGPGGRIQKRDVLKAAATLQREMPHPTPGDDGSHLKVEPPAPATTAAATDSGAPPTGDQVIPFTRMRQRIAERLTLSKQTIPHFHLSQEVDMTEAQQWRQTFNQSKSCHVTVTDLIISAVARALTEFRRLNAHVDNDRLLVRQAVNVGVATAVEDGLLTPVIAEADQKTLLEISRIAKQNAEAARRGVMDSNVSSTFTISSLGQFDIPLFHPIINPPETGLLAVGAIQPRVVPVPGGIGVRQMMWLNLACDHRAVDGAYAARFLARLKALLETPGTQSIQ
jgi:pyruvate dehydrogenase E2 component (dihydrolipoamide acetyltransferase)